MLEVLINLDDHILLYFLFVTFIANLYVSN